MTIGKKKRNPLAPIVLFFKQREVIQMLSRLFVEELENFFMHGKEGSTDL